MAEQDSKADKHELTKIALPALTAILVAIIGAYATMHTRAKPDAKPLASIKTEGSLPPSMSTPTRAERCTSATRRL